MPRVASTSIAGSRPARTAPRATSRAGPRSSALTAPAAKGNRPLHAAPAFGRVEVAGLLLDRGADVAARNAQGRTALHDAVEPGRSRVSDMLMRRGATVDARLPASLGRLDRLRDFGGVAALSRPADVDPTRRA